jgi:hypothetical protein
MVLADCTFATAVTVQVLEVWLRFVVDTMLPLEQTVVLLEMQKVRPGLTETKIVMLLKSTVRKLFLLPTSALTCN